MPHSLHSHIATRDAPLQQTTVQICAVGGVNSVVQYLFPDDPLHMVCRTMFGDALEVGIIYRMKLDGRCDSSRA